MIVLLSVFAFFIPALLLPGPDFVAVVRMSVSRGVCAGMLTAVGVSIGLASYAALSLLGLSAILLEYQWLAWGIRVCGGGYLVYLGVRLLWTPRAVIDASPPSVRSGGSPLLFGLLVSLTNPKAIVLFTSIFATAANGAVSLPLSLLIVALVFTSTLAWYAVVAVFVGSGTVMARFRAAQHWIERISGVCFIAIGGRLLADSRNPVSP